VLCTSECSESLISESEMVDSSSAPQSPVQIFAISTSQSLTTALVTQFRAYSTYIRTMYLALVAQQHPENAGEGGEEKRKSLQVMLKFFLLLMG